MTQKKGFTLIELLIAVTIVMILATISIVFYSEFLQNARDAKRQADLNAIRSALEQYFADQIFYPTFASGCNPGSVSIPTTVGCALTNPGNTKKYMNTVPSDPISSNPQYYYQPLPNPCDDGVTKCTSYCLYAKMENTSSIAPSGCSFPSGYNFAVTVP